MAFFRKRGYYVIRSAQSKGLIDFVALGMHQVAFLVQCKRSGKISGKELEELGTLSKRTAQDVLVMGSPKRKMELWIVDWEDNTKIPYKSEYVLDLTGK